MDEARCYPVTRHRETTYQKLNHMLFGQKWVWGLKKTRGTRRINRRRTLTDTDIFERATLPEQRKLSFLDNVLLLPVHKPNVPICRIRVAEFTISGKQTKSIFALHEVQGINRQTGVRGLVCVYLRVSAVELKSDTMITIIALINTTLHTYFPGHLFSKPPAWITSLS